MFSNERCKESLPFLFRIYYNILIRPFFNIAHTLCQLGGYFRYIDNSLCIFFHRAVGELALEAEKMLQFMEETAMEGYRKLLGASQGYQVSSTAELTASSASFIRFTD